MTFYVPCGKVERPLSNRVHYFPPPAVQPSDELIFTAFVIVLPFLLHTYSLGGQMLNRYEFGGSYSLGN